MKNKNIKKISLILFVLSLSSFSLFGCRLKSEEKPKTKEEITESIKVIEKNEQDLLNKIQPSEEQKEKLAKEIESNKENNVFSDDISGAYILSDANSNNLKKIAISNVSKNLSTKEDYGSIWVETNNVDTLSNYGVFYAFSNEIDYDYFIKNIPQIFCDTKIIDTTYEEKNIALDNVFINKVFKIKCVDELNVEFYGYAFTYDIDNGNDILCVSICKTPYMEEELDDILNKFANIE